MKTKNVTVGLRIPESLRAEAAAVAEKFGLSQGDGLRLAVRIGLTLLKQGNFSLAMRKGTAPVGDQMDLEPQLPSKAA